MTTDITEITVIGDDDTGLVANVTSLLFERGINIEDLDQAVRDGVFRMYLAVDTSEMVCTQETLREDLRKLGDDLGLDVQVRFPADRETQQIAVLGTKESHCLEAIFEAWANDELGADIGVVIGNHDDLQPLAEHYDVPFHDIGDEKGQQNEDELLDLLAEYDVDLIVLARYMRDTSGRVRRRSSYPSCRGRPLRRFQYRAATPGQRNAASNRRPDRPPRPRSLAVDGLEQLLRVPLQRFLEDLVLDEMSKGRIALGRRQRLERLPSVPVGDGLRADDIREFVALVGRLQFADRTRALRFVGPLVEGEVGALLRRP